VEQTDNIMRIFLLTLAVYLAAVAETSLADLIAVGHVVPDLLTTVAMIWLLTASGSRIFLAAGGIGLAGDLIGPGRVGVGLAGLLLIGYAVARLRARFPLENLPARVLTIWAGVTILAVGQAFARWVLGEVAVGLPTAVTRALGVGAYTVGVSLPLLMVIGWIREPYLARQNRLPQF